MILLALLTKSSVVSFLPLETAHYSKSIGNLENLDANREQLAHPLLDADNLQV